MKSDVTLAKERFKSYLLLFFGFGVAIIVPEIMAGIPDKTIIFRKFDLWWPLLTSIFTWAKKWPKWLRTGSLRAVDRRIARPSSFPSFRVRGGGSFWPPPPWRRWLRPPPGRGLNKSFTQVRGGIICTCARAHPFSISRKRLGGLRSNLVCGRATHSMRGLHKSDVGCICTCACAVCTLPSHNGASSPARPSPIKASYWYI